MTRSGCLAGAGKIGFASSFGERIRRQLCFRPPCGSIVMSFGSVQTSEVGGVRNCVPKCAIKARISNAVVAPPSRGCQVCRFGVSLLMPSAQQCASGDESMPSARIPGVGAGGARNQTPDSKARERWRRGELRLAAAQKNLGACATKA